MKFKIVPAPRSHEFVAEAQQALPLIPSSENDCCARLVDRTALDARETAREWVTFLRALGLAEETESGYRRLRRDPDLADLAAAFRETVFGADAVLDVLDAADEPLGVEEVYERFREEVPNWERYRRADWDDEWRKRVERLLDWAVVFGLAERVDGAYRSD
ncbi:MULTISPECIES: hypothetical protein [Halococcus]|uniref:Uncharacterized protein n=1 Tax=Halococcus salifodinae DSM 8989 TaxID=1227456 RepID=M0MXB7_9EURY|nr:MULTISPECIES: hypothetical protein [Halococcus]EMA49963.1 hypothetical protein C450_16860 [Halococcus salifodinae DSM 8989]